MADLRLYARTLTYRERQVLALMMNGYTRAEAGQELYLTENTIKSHLRLIRMKLAIPKGAASTISAGVAAAREGYLRWTGAEWVVTAPSKTI